MASAVKRTLYDALLLFIADAVQGKTDSLTAAGSAAASGSATLTVTADLHAAGSAAASGSATLTATADLHAAGSAAASGSATITATADLHAAGSAAASGSATLSVADSLTAAGSAAASGSATITATADLGAAGSAAASGSATLTKVAAPSPASSPFGPPQDPGRQPLYESFLREERLRRLLEQLPDETAALLLLRDFAREIDARPDVRSVVEGCVVVERVVVPIPVPVERVVVVVDTASRARAAWMTALGVASVGAVGILLARVALRAPRRQRLARRRAA